MRLATTGSYTFDDGVRPYPVPPYLAVGLARSLAAMLPPTPAAAALCAGASRHRPLRRERARVSGARRSARRAPRRWRSSSCCRTGTRSASASSTPRCPSTSAPRSPTCLRSARDEPPCAGRDRDGAARPLFPRRRVASARRSLAARSAHGDVSARPRDAAPERSLPRRARTAERVLRPRPGSRGYAAGVTVDVDPAPPSVILRRAGTTDAGPTPAVATSSSIALRVAASHP